MGADSAKFVSRKVRDVELQAIRTLSFLEFTTIQEAARILHMRPYDLMERKHLFITRLSKNKHFFHKKSIELYAQKGDGRFKISYTHSPLTNDEIVKWENDRNLLNEIKANVDASTAIPMRVVKTFAVSEDHPLNHI